MVIVMVAETKPIKIINTSSKIILETDFTLFRKFANNFILQEIETFPEIRPLPMSTPLHMTTVCKKSNCTLNLFHHNSQGITSTKKL